jgi:hypothetical protein
MSGPTTLDCVHQSITYRQGILDIDGINQPLSATRSHLALLKSRASVVHGVNSRSLTPPKTRGFGMTVVRTCSLKCGTSTEPSHLINSRPQSKPVASGAKAPHLRRFTAGLKPRPSGRANYEIGSGFARIHNSLGTSIRSATETGTGPVCAQGPAQAQCKGGCE